MERVLLQPAKKLLQPANLEGNKKAPLLLQNLAFMCLGQKTKMTNRVDCDSLAENLICEFVTYSFLTYSFIKGDKIFLKMFY